tara:strand:+ start:1847 stop:2287 length:441 start_codon:yes stop_codon:yes gene_type:complete
MKKTHLIGSLLTAATIVFASSVMSHGVEVPLGSKSLQMFKNAQEMPIASMNEPGVNAYFEDIVGSADPKAPLSCGMFKIEKGNELVYTYDYDDTKIILDGHIYFADGTQKVKGEKGDVLFFPKGATITFSTDESGLAYACGQRKLF